MFNLILQSSPRVTTSLKTKDRYRFRNLNPSLIRRRAMSFRVSATRYQQMVSWYSELSYQCTRAGWRRCTIETGMKHRRIRHKPAYSQARRSRYAPVLLMSILLVALLRATSSPIVLGHWAGTYGCWRWTNKLFFIELDSQIKHIKSTTFDRGNMWFFFSKMWYWIY